MRFGLKFNGQKKLGVKYVNIMYSTELAYDPRENCPQYEANIYYIYIYIYYL